jgi:hypothetical protein
LRIAHRLPRAEALANTVAFGETKICGDSAAEFSYRPLGRSHLEMALMDSSAGTAGLRDAVMNERCHPLAPSQ